MKGSREFQAESDRIKGGSGEVGQTVDGGDQDELLSDK